LEKANYLYNLQLLQGDENNNKRAKDPEVWIAEEYTTSDKVIDYKRKNFIQEDLALEWANIKTFDKYISAQLIKQLKAIPRSP